MSWLYSKWWKWLCVALLLYVLIGGMVVPLAPGISNVSPSVFKTDTTYTFTVTGFNTHFDKQNNLQLWFKSGGDYYCPQAVSITSATTLQATFAVSSLQQDSIKDINFDVVMNDDVDGTFALREGVTLIKSTAIDTLPHESAKVCEVVVQNNKHQLFAFPYREILYETIRNTFYHVPMWFVMTMMVFFSLFFSIRYLMTGKVEHDIYASNAVVVAILFGVCGYLTGMIWSKYTWFIGMGWAAAIQNMVFQDIKLAGALISVAAYMAYMVLRGSITDEIKRARISAVYNVFAVVIFMLFVFVVPRLTDSLHPGNGGNPAFSKYDLDSHLRMFFYPAVIGWIMLGFWILSVLIRIRLLEQKQEE